MSLSSGDQSLRKQWNLEENFEESVNRSFKVGSGSRPFFYRGFCNGRRCAASTSTVISTETT